MSKQTTQLDNEPAKVYPSIPDEDGFFYETSDDEETQVMSKIYPNDSKVKKVVLKDGRSAIVRQLKGKDMVNIKRWMQNDKDIDFDSATISQATTIDGNSYPPDSYTEMPIYDYSRILGASQTLNFQ